MFNVVSTEQTLSTQIHIFVVQRRPTALREEATISTLYKLGIYRFDRYLNAIISSEITLLAILYFPL